ncbi:MAG: hypothetical protein WC749_16265 [Dehalococcoidia bacterium]
MAQTAKAQKIIRLEDFIALANEGKPIELAIQLKKQIVMQKTQSGEADDLSVGTEMYLLMAQYSQTGVAGEMPGVTKIYVHGWVGESKAEAEVNRHIANERLIMDYTRLRNGGVIFKEKFFRSE